MRVLEELFYEHTILGTSIIEYLRWNDDHVKVYEHLSLVLKDTDLRTHGYDDTTRAIKQKKSAR
jgi:hypothetical protein